MLPNPIPAPIVEKRPPTPAEVRERREAARHTQQQAGETIYSNAHTWRKWENGQRQMPLGLYHLYCLLTAPMMKMPWHE